MKQALTTAPILRHFDPSLPTLLRTDASEIGSGGILLQQENNEWRPVAYCSHKFTPAELNYSTIEKEGFGIIHAVQSFSSFIDGLPFTIETDHKNLIYMNNCTTARVQRWRAILLGFHYKIRHIAGKDNVFADALSRGTEADTDQDTREPSLVAVELLQDNLT